MKLCNLYFMHIVLPLIVLLQSIGFGWGAGVGLDVGMAFIWIWDEGMPRFLDSPMQYEFGIPVVVVRVVGHLLFDVFPLVIVVMAVRWIYYTCDENRMAAFYKLRAMAKMMMLSSIVFLIVVQLLIDWNDLPQDEVSSIESAIVMYVTSMTLSVLSYCGLFGFGVNSQFDRLEYIIKQKEGLL